MPKKNAARSARPRTQKHFELVRPAQAESQAEESDVTGPAADVATAETEENATIEEQVETREQEISSVAATGGTSRRSRSRTVRSAPALATPREEVAAPVPAAEVAKEVENDSDKASASEALPKGSAAARMAARRQGMQKTQQRAAALISPEHYVYVRHDLLIIAILAIIMFTAIIILHFVPGIGY